MRTALAPVVVASDDSIHDAVLAVARAYLAVHPVELLVRGQRNCGPWSGSTCRGARVTTSALE